MAKPKSRGFTDEGAAMNDFIVTLFRANGHVITVGDRLLKDLGLTSTRWQVLGAIKDGPKTVAQIARRFESTRQGVLFVVNNMVNEGFVRFADNPDHKRAKLVDFTPRGSEVYAEVSRRQQTWINSVSKRFETDELRTAVAFLKKVTEQVTDH